MLGSRIGITEQGLKRIEEIRKELYPEDDAIQPKKEKTAQQPPRSEPKHNEKQMEAILEQLRAKDEQLKEKDNQLKKKDSQIKSMWDELHARDQQMRTLIDSVNSVYRSMSLIEHRMNDIEANTKPDPGQPKRSAIHPDPEPENNKTTVKKPIKPG